MSGAHRAFPATRRVRRAPLFAWAASSFILTAAGVAVWTSIGDVGHGWWLASFLALVAGVAQLLLGAGQRALSAPPPAAQARSSSAQLFAVLSGLSLPLRGSSPSTRHIRHAHIAYLALVTFLTASVIVGTGLAWDLPWV